MKVSAIILTKNEEANIQRCLDSLSPVSDEILVIDSGSHDRTIELAEAHPKTRVIKTAWLGFSQTRNFGMTQASHEYVLFLDADEALSPELEAEVLNHKENLSGAYTVPRLTSYCGQWIHHCGWRPDRQWRLFPKSKAKWTGEFVHERLEVQDDVTVTHLSSDLLHYSYVSVEDHIQRINRYSTLSAMELAQKPRSFLLLRGSTRALIRFFKQYLLKGGFRDGRYGLYICLLTAFMVFLKHLKAQDLLKNKKGPSREA